MKYYLRELSKKDLPYINKWRNSKEIVEALGSPFRYIGLEVDEAWFNSYLGSRSNNIRLVIDSDENQQPVGAVYLLGIDWIARSAEFSIWIGEVEAQGKGVGKFAAAQIINHAINDLGLNRIHLTVLADNARAISLYQKIGFQQEGILKDAAYKNGKFTNMVQMALLARNYVKA